MKREIIWEKVHYDFNPVTNRLTKEEEEASEYKDEYGALDNIVSMPTLEEVVPVKNVTVTPFGVFNMDDSMHPFKQFKFWMGHTNFNISHSIKEKIKKIDGVEVLKVISRYRFLIAVGTAFTYSNVCIAIKEAICGKEIQNVELSDGKLISEVIKTLKDNCKYWVLYIFPNGNYDYASSEQDNDVAFLDKKNSLYEASLMSNGIYLTSDTICSLIEKK